jgi:hypothetical protein
LHALRDRFGDRSPSIITKLKTRQPLADDERYAQDIITDLVNNKSETVKTVDLDNEEQDDDGGKVKAYVNIMRFGTRKGHYIYFIQFFEGDKDGYFDSMMDARNYVEAERVPRGYLDRPPGRPSRKR